METTVGDQPATSPPPAVRFGVTSGLSPRLRATVVILAAQGITQLLGGLAWLLLPVLFPGSSVSGQAALIVASLLWAGLIVASLGLWRRAPWAWWAAVVGEGIVVTWTLLALTIGLGPMSGLNVLVAAAVLWLLLTPEGRLPLPGA
jgi:uncharacterized membrane protein (DUF2068 family)